LNNLGELARMRGDRSGARELANDSLARARERRDDLNAATALDTLGQLDYEECRFDAARSKVERAPALQRQIGHRQGEGESLWLLGNITRERGDRDAASQFYSEALSIRGDLGHRRGVALILVDMGILAAERGDSESARSHLREGLETLQQLGYLPYL